MGREAIFDEVMTENFLLLKKYSTDQNFTI